MKRIRWWLLGWCLAGSLTLNLPALGALPMAVDGEPLPSLAPMLERVLPAVVNIYTESRVTERQSPFQSDPFFEKFFGTPPLQQRERRVSSLGSGVIMDAEAGYVITNSHVIAGADEISVRLHDGRAFDAQIVGVDEDADIAVVQIAADALQQIDPGDSDGLRVGDFVVAINTAILAPGGGNIGIGFAIPINMVQLLTRQIIEYGEVRRGRLGVIAQNLTPELAEALGIDTTRGAVIAQVIPDSAADDAGIQEGDVVVAVNEREIVDASSLRNTIGLFRADEEIEVSFLRDGKRQSMQIRIRAIEPLTGQGLKINKRLEGIRLADIDDEDGPQGQRGVRAVEVAQTSLAWRAGLREGDLIISVNKQPIYSLKDVEHAVDEDDVMLLLNVVRGNTGLFIVIR
jgi:S1-C subfamily serine protease